jgi:hypothetical protein
MLREEALLDPRRGLKLALRERRGPGPPEEGLHASLEFAGAEGLRKNVVGPPLKGLEAVRLGGARRDYEDVGVAEEAERAADLEAVEIGEAEVQGNEVRRNTPGSFQSRISCACACRLEPLTGERRLEETSDIGIVLDDECSTWHGTPFYD